MEKRFFKTDVIAHDIGALREVWHDHDRIITQGRVGLLLLMC